LRIRFGLRRIERRWPASSTEVFNERASAAAGVHAGGALASKSPVREAR